MPGIVGRGPGQRRPSPVRFALMGLLLLAVAGCKTGEEEPRFQTRGMAFDQPIPVEVDNNNFLDVTVYAMDGGANIRLGNVVGKSTERFTIDPQRITASGGLRLLVDPIGASDAFLSDRVMVGAGQIVVLRVGSLLSQSFISLR